MHVAQIRNHPEQEKKWVNKSFLFTQCEASQQFGWKWKMNGSIVFVNWFFPYKYFLFIIHICLEWRYIVREYQSVDVECAWIHEMSAFAMETQLSSRFTFYMIKGNHVCDGMMKKYHGIDKEWIPNVIILLESLILSSVN